ncbi:MAG: alpha/beta hydrolase [Pseudomonadota bacterium]
MTSPITVMFLPGMLADHRLWLPGLDYLHHLVGAGVIVPVFPDFTDCETVEAMAERVLENAPARFAIVGMSMGGYVAFELMRRVPDRISHLMLVNTQAGADDAKTRRRRQMLAQIVGTHRPFQGVSGAVLDDMLHPEHRHDAGIIKTLSVMADDLGVAVYRRQQRAVALRRDCRDILPDLTMPCAIVGGLADKITPPVAQQIMADAIPMAQMTMVAGAGHYVPLECPDIFAGILADLLMRRDP